MTRTFKRETRSAACSNVSPDISSTILLIVASVDCFAEESATAVDIHLDEEVIVLEDLFKRIRKLVWRSGRPKTCEAKDVERAKERRRPEQRDFEHAKIQ